MTRNKNKEWDCMGCGKRHLFVRPNLFYGTPHCGNCYLLAVFQYLEKLRLAKKRQP